MENQNSTSFPIPLWVGWVVNLAGWVLFVSTFEQAIELVAGLLCLGCVFIGYKHKQMKSPAFLDMDTLSPGNLIYSSAFEAIWMFSWGLGLFGDFDL